METVCSSKTSVYFNGLHGVVSQKRNVHNHCCENLRSYNSFKILFGAGTGQVVKIWMLDLAAIIWSIIRSVMVNWESWLKALRLLTCIREVPGSNLNQDSDYHDSFSWFSSKQIQRITVCYVMTASIHIFSNSFFTVIQSFDATRFELLIAPISKLQMNE
jgi:hypothetical protein